MSTKINYLDELYSPITGCSGKGCSTKETCWAKAMVKRFPGIHGYEPESEDGIIRGWGELPFEKVQFHPGRFEKPMYWSKPRRIGVCFLGDLFDEQVPDDWIWKVLERATFGNRRHTYFFLTKQPKRMADWFESHKEKFWHYHQGPYVSAPWPDPCLWWGVSITSQPDAYRMIPELLRIPGKKWISLEPYLQGPIDIERYLPDPPERIPFRLDYLEWVVIGCESGPHRRPCKLEWMIDVVEQCKAAGVKCFVKQIDVQGKVCHDINQFPKELQVRERP